MAKRRTKIKVVINLVAREPADDMQAMLEAVDNALKPGDIEINLHPHPEPRPSSSEQFEAETKELINNKLEESHQAVKKTQDPPPRQGTATRDEQFAAIARLHWLKQLKERTRLDSNFRNLIRQGWLITSSVAHVSADAAAATKDLSDIINPSS